MRKTFLRIIHSDWFIGLGLLLLYLATNGYTYAWDDQHLEIPLLKSLIDPTLYAGDYYVESLKRNFTSFLFPLLAKVISVEQIPQAYFILYLLARYTFFFWIFKLWKHLSKSTSTAILAVMMLISVGRVEEFLYRTFSHQELALGIIAAGIYFFYKDRFVLAAIIFGLAANIHALYSLFPFLYMLIYLLCNFPRHGGRTVFLTSLGFFLSSLPFIIWTFIKRSIHPIAITSWDEGWIALYLKACPQNFIFQDIPLKAVLSNAQTFLQATRAYWPLLALYLLNRIYFPDFRSDRKTRVAIAVGFWFLILSFIFTYLYPTRFILDLNLVRHSQYMLFFLIGYTTLFYMRLTKEPTWLLTVLVLFLPLIRFGEYICSFGILAVMLILSLRQQFAKKDYKKIPMVVLGIKVFTLTVVLYYLSANFFLQKFNSSTIESLLIIWGLILFLALSTLFFKNPRLKILIKTTMIFVPAIIFSFHYSIYHYNRLKVERAGSAGYWQLQKSWVDMQDYVRNNTPKNSLIMIPYDMTMCGFRISSERKIICSYRDCGIVGFDEQAGVEWQKRVKDIEPFKVLIPPTTDITPAIQNAIFKYKANYIVFMNYRAPKPNPLLEFIYRNDIFSLYRVVLNPI